MVKEFCCGFSLRIGVLILSWSILIQNCICSLLALIAIFSIRNTTDKTALVYFGGYYLIWSVAGIVVSVLGILAIQKNKAKLLNGIFCYFVYGVISNIVLSITFLILPYLLMEDTQDPRFTRTFHVRLSGAQFFGISAIGLLFWAAFIVYFASVVKTCRDEMLKNKPINVISTRRMH